MNDVGHMLCESTFFSKRLVNVGETVLGPTPWGKAAMVMADVAAVRAKAGSMRKLCDE